MKFPPLQNAQQLTQAVLRNCFASYMGDTCLPRSNAVPKTIKAMEEAYEDATKRKELRPKWVKEQYHQGAALMFMKVRHKSSALRSQVYSSESVGLRWRSLRLWHSVR